MTGLQLRDLTVAFGGQPPVLQLDRLDLPTGARLAVTGPSGCGKTTLAMALCGIQPARGARIDWDGQDIAALSEGARDRWRRRQVGLVFQDFHLLPGLSVLQNVLAATYFAAWRPTPAQTARARELLERFGVPVARGEVASLSRGEQQRVAIARALLADPPILIADEPTASLDRDSADRVIRLLDEETARHGRTLIAVSHDPRLIEALGRSIRLEGGRLVD